MPPAPHLSAAPHSPSWTACTASTIRRPGGAHVPEASGGASAEHPAGQRVAHDGWGSGTIPSDHNDRPFTFGFIGDTPYNRLDQQGLKRVMAGLDDTELEFVLHVGDIKSRGERCSDILLSDRLEMLDRSQHPLVYTPGDNEWTDCGWIDPDDPFAPGTPLDRLHWLRTHVYHHPESLGAKRMRVEQQRQMITQLSVKDSNDLNQPRLPENMRWRIGSLQFCTIHVVGSNNAMFATPAMREAWALRQQANAIWLTETAVLAKRYGAKGLVIATHANMGLERPATTAGRPPARPSWPLRPTSAVRWPSCTATPTSSAPTGCCSSPTGWKTSPGWNASARRSPGSGSPSAGTPRPPPPSAPTRNAAPPSASTRTTPETRKLAQYVIPHQRYGSWPDTHHA